MQPRQRHREAAAGQPHALGHLGDDADLRVRIVVPGHEQHAIVAADVDRQRDRHAREDHRVVEGMIRSLFIVAPW